MYKYMYVGEGDKDRRPISLALILADTAKKWAWWGWYRLTERAYPGRYRRRASILT
jgi:hypothetical protein